MFQYSAAVCVHARSGRRCKCVEYVASHAKAVSVEGQ